MNNMNNMNHQQIKNNISNRFVLPKLDITNINNELQSPPREIKERSPTFYR